VLIPSAMWRECTQVFLWHTLSFLWRLTCAVMRNYGHPVRPFVSWAIGSRRVAFHHFSHWRHRIVMCCGWGRVHVYRPGLVLAIVGPTCETTSSSSSSSSNTDIDRTWTAIAAIGCSAFDGLRCTRRSPGSVVTLRKRFVNITLFRLNHRKAMNLHDWWRRANKVPAFVAESNPTRDRASALKTALYWFIT